MGDVFLSLLPFHCGVEFVYERNSSDISREISVLIYLEIAPALISVKRKRER